MASKQTRYYVSEAEAKITTTTTTTTPGTLTVAAKDEKGLMITGFEVGSDKLFFAGRGDLSADEFKSFFSMNMDDVTGDGVADTTIGLTNSSWSVTLVGVHDATLSELAYV
jgi:hypothetical protein